MIKPDSEGSSQPLDVPERIVYVYPAAPLVHSDDIALHDVWRALKRDRWILIALSLLGLGGGVLYAAMAPGWFRAEVRMMPQLLGGGSPLGTQTSPIGELAGLSRMTLEWDIKNGTLALVRSHDFLRRFVVDESLVEATSRLAGTPLDIDAAAAVLAGVTSIHEEVQSGIFVLGVNWKDAATAADVANRMTAEINRVSRDKAISEADANISFLRQQTSGVQDAYRSQAISKLLEAEHQKLVVAKGRMDFAVRVVDTARVPTEKYGPRRHVIAAAGFAGGLFLALMAVFVRSVFRRAPE